MNESFIADDQLLVTPEEAARRLSVGRTTIYELMASGELQSVNIGRCRRVPVSSLSSFVNRLIGDAIVGQSRSAASVEPAPGIRNSLANRPTKRLICSQVRRLKRVARTRCLARRWPQRERSTRPLASSMISQTVWRSQSALSPRSSTSGSNDSWTSSPRSSRTLQRARRSRSGRDQRYGDSQLPADRSGVATGCWAGPPCSPSRRSTPAA